MLMMPVYSKKKDFPFIICDNSLHSFFYSSIIGTNNEDNLNHLNIKLFNTNLVLRHPLSSKKESNEINLPLNELNIGWNKIYIRKRRNKVQVVTDNSGSRKGVQNFTLSEDFDSDADPQATLVTGLYSLGKCLNENDLVVEFTTIFERNHLLDYLSFCTRKQINSWLFRKRIHSILMSFVVEKDRKYVKMAKIPSTLSPSVKNVKTDQFRSFLSKHCQRCVRFFQSFRTRGMKLVDNMNYNYTVFVDLVLENIGNDDFFVEMEVINPSSAPISGLKVCGFNDKKSNVNRIVGGKAADPKDWPWMAALLKIE
ncbi:hypothetical protein Avbf_12188 [Armadillidium vulgare]|nr:hypothetical protein Avbf_12188 [Armadillidium vulgare]